jgi:hypothetical protein
MIATIHSMGKWYISGSQTQNKGQGCSSSVLLGAYLSIGLAIVLSIASRAACSTPHCCSLLPLVYIAHKEHCNTVMNYLSI